MTIRRAGGLVEEHLSHSVIGAFFAVHRQLGFGFLESVYSRALEAELIGRGHKISREFGVAVRYRGIEIAQQRLDLVVDSKLIVEIKATEGLRRDACRQLFNYLRATNLEVGLLLHFGRFADFYRIICQNHMKPFPLNPAPPSNP
ncbi:MAG: GxxExxY protein [Gemmatimonadales bacterium]|jgi:GxxExxY protein